MRPTFYLIRSLIAPRFFTGVTNDIFTAISAHNVYCNRSDREHIAKIKYEFNVDVSKTVKALPWTPVCFLTGFPSKECAEFFNYRVNAISRQKYKRYTIEGRIQAITDVIEENPYVVKVTWFDHQYSTTATGAVNEYTEYHKYKQ